MQSFIVEDRLFRAVRAWPIWHKGSEQYLLTELGHEVNVDGVSFDTAPVKNGAVFSLMGISQDEQTQEAKLHNPTDHLSTKGTLEFAYLKIGQQIVQHELAIPYQRDRSGSYRTLIINERVTLGLNNNHRDVTGCTLNLIDAFTAAGIRIDVTFDVTSQINLELADTYVGASIASIHSVFPGHESLRDHDTQMAIHADIEKIFKNAEILGFTIDIERKNMLNPEYRSSKSTPFFDPEAAATALAARYGHNP
jgi:hypothetical protein